nr:nucleotidyltransferase domain-containing protein [Kibdelosporangium sp. MJ126-NF4]CEL18027.1 hypothetical protein [Kibdelosporangium sp. MJ126-NF4]CTQ90745.1 hypothetical protein [Kibdelosporangium sp. MJ126-NF4]
MPEIDIAEQLPHRVRTVLHARGVDFDELAALVDVQAGETLLLAGSYASGEANETSDLDLLVITDDRAVSAPPKAANHPSIFGDSFDIDLGAIIVNLEYVTASRLADLNLIVRSARHPVGRHFHLPNLQALEMRLVQRVDTGIPLWGFDVAAQLRSDVDAEAVRASAAALNFVMAVSLLEDTRVLASPARELMFRAAGESLLLAAVNAHGPITYDIKHLAQRAGRLAALRGAPKVFAERDRVVFVDRLEPAEATSTLAELANDLDRSFALPSCPDLVPRMLKPFRAQWERARILY